MVKTYDELKDVKRELKSRIHQTEQNYLDQHEWISTLMEASGIHKGKKTKKTVKNFIQ